MAVILPVLCSREAFSELCLFPPYLTKVYMFEPEILLQLKGTRQGLGGTANVQVAVQQAVNGLKKNQ